MCIKPCDIEKILLYSCFLCFSSGCIPYVVKLWITSLLNSALAGTIFRARHYPYYKYSCSSGHTFVWSAANSTAVSIYLSRIAAITDCEKHFTFTSSDSFRYDIRRSTILIENWLLNLCVKMLTTIWAEMLKVTTRKCLVRNPRWEVGVKPNCEDTTWDASRLGQSARVRTLAVAPDSSYH